MRSTALVPAIAGALILAGGYTVGAQTLTLGVSAEITSLDPQFQNLSSNSQFAAAIFEQLVDRDATAQLVPKLAESWELIDETTWEFKLRPGVKFHNGNDFTAEDVVFSINRIPTIENSPGPYTTYTSSIEAVEAVDPLTVRFTTKAPNPVLPIDLAAIFMLDHETHEGASGADFDSGEMMVGTGPLLFQSYRPREVVELTRNDEYWGDPVEWERISYRMIVDDAARVAALLSGGVQFIDQVPPSTVPRIEEEENLKVVEFPSLRSVFFVLDQTGDGPFAFTNEGEKLPPEVFQAQRVRQALSLAIDRQAIVDRIMEGAAFPSGQLMPEGAPGYVEEIAVPEANIEEAQRLLTEAGYPDGFRVTLHGPNGQYPNDAAIIQAVGQMWSRIGITTEVVVQPFAGFLGRAANQEFSAWLASWGSSTGEAGNTLRSLVQTWDDVAQTGAANRHRYSDPELDALIEKANTEMNEELRLQYMEDAMTKAMEDVAVIPVLMLQNVVAMDAELEYTGRIDSRIQPQDIRPGG